MSRLAPLNGFPTGIPSLPTVTRIRSDYGNLRTLQSQRLSLSSSEPHFRSLVPLVSDPRLSDALLNTKLIFVMGKGGQGKTTLSASLALSLSSQGKKVDLITFDAARRLGDVLGIGSLGFEPQSLALSQ